MKISIVTVCYNSEKTIEQTIKSVVNQTYKNIEYIIVDGKSKDGTLDIIKKYKKKYPKIINYITEKDKGIFDAMNKGIKMATGDYIGILNSDDLLANSNVIKKMANLLKKEDYDGFYANIVYMNNELDAVKRNVIAGKVSKKLGWVMPHGTMYLKKTIYEEFGYYDLNYKITADYEFTIRMLRKYNHFAYLREYFLIMRVGGVSTAGLKGYLKNFKEATRSLKANNIKFAFFINIYRAFATIMQMVSAKINNKKIMDKLKINENGV